MSHLEQSRGGLEVLRGHVAPRTKQGWAGGVERTWQCVVAPRTKQLAARRC